MGLTRSSLERQISLAVDARTACEKALAEQGIVDKAVKKQTKWRQLNAVCRQLTRRLNAVAAIEKQNAALLARKEEAVAAE
ncbi:MAG: hypothetical protein R3C01_11020 [Planctomycetaceae bacterium]